jgi:hypothetical protein
MTTYINPTVLYIKQHSITGLKYFGKTTKKDPYKYKGSGADWTLHLKKHGSEHVITTIVFGPCIDKDTIVEFALAFSKEHNIVESKDWANIKPENGLDGGVPGVSSPNKGRPSPLRGKPNGKKGIPNGKKGIPNGRKGKPSGRKGIPNGKQRNPSGPTQRKGIPNGRKGILTGPNGRKGIPTGRKGIPNGKQQNPAPEVECPHCGKIGRGGVMKQHHFDNCKKKLDVYTYHET